MNVGNNLYNSLMMQEDFQCYKQSNIQFSSSKLYFQNQNKILQQIGFVSPLSLDIHFKYTFQEIRENYFIEGGEFEGITVDHDVHEQGLIYKIGFLNPKYQNIECVSLDLKKNLLDNPSIFPLLGGFMGWGIVFGLLFFLHDKGQFWNVLFLLNIVGGGILFLFLIWKVFKGLYNKYVKAKRVDYGGYTVSFSRQTDALMLSTNVLNVLKKMNKEFWITNFCYTGNCIYLLQDIHDRDGKRVSSSSNLYSEQEKAGLQQRTLNYINQSEFLSLFIGN